MRQGIAGPMLAWAVPFWILSIIGAAPAIADAIGLDQIARGLG